MTLAPGIRLGTYEILGPLGAGGMGEVYRARDTRLGRDVAVKVLPQHLSAHPEIRTRFEREAKTLSSLNHPHICVLHDIGRDGDTDFLVMELVEGETLADRLAKGPLPVPEVLRFGGQIADALDRAHREGVIHRDLKPGNVMLTRSGAKLMDFGLARETGLAGAPGSGVSMAALTASPTMAQPLTAEGSIVGTYQYMAPEQLEGKEADERSDIWGLGCILYEMATGQGAFRGKSQASLISSIMSSEPQPISHVSPLTPPGLERLVRGCLAKDPEERLRTAHDVKLQLQWIAEGGSQAGVPAVLAGRRRSRERLAWSLCGVTALATVVLLVLRLGPRPAAKPVIFELTPPAQVGFVDLPRISPDGRMLAFNAGDSSGTPAIWVRQMNSLQAQKLPGTDGASRPFWSPDSRFLAYFAGGKLYKIDIAGGPPLTICDAPRGSDGSWGRGDVILFDGATGDTVQRVSASGGIPAGATTVNRKAGETFTAWPQFLPDGKHFLFVCYGPGERRMLCVGMLGSLQAQTLGPAASRAEFTLGHMLYVRQGTLLAQPFDAGTRKFRGDPFPVAENVEFDAIGSARFSASTEGTLVYRSGGSVASRGLTWLDRSGKTIGSVGGLADYDNPALSPDGSQLAVGITDPARGLGDIWVWDLSRNLGSRVTFAKRDTYDPVWMPDGRGVLFTMEGESGADLFVRRLGGPGTDSLLLRSSDQKLACGWSPDGRVLLYFSRSPSATRRWDVVAFVPGDSLRPRPLVATDFNEYQPSISPDGRLFAYVSWESGKEEVYVQTFPNSGGKWRISTDGGREPSWRRDGRELFYAGAGKQMLSVKVEPGATPKFSLPEKLFDATAMVPETLNRNRYVATPDGQRFLVVTSKGAAHVGATTVVLDWLAQHRKR
ncbi:MAG: serine/threonine-protein kinase [Candidatus Eisenbacteria bacterium]|nr:serine/threonine-protein kinase [Candidatus Eisenbacteria bacterium]